MATGDNTTIQKAREWIDRVNTANGLASGWRLEMISKRYRYQKDAQTGTKKRVPVRIRRFARGLPVGLVHEAIRYLDSLAPYTGFIFNGELVTLKYRPTNTTWIRDDQHAVDGNAGGTYTLIQDLIEEGSLDDFEAPSTGSCSEEILTKWVWDATTVEDLPQWEQGVTYSLQAVNRKEDGTFDYALVRRRALTQHLAESVSECNEFETVYTEAWDNVYGIPPDFEDDTGTSINVPVPCDSDKGTTVARQITENPDCTYRIVVTRRVANGAASAESCAQTKFEHTDGETVRGAPSALGEAPVAKDGVTETHRSEVRPDGLYDTTREVRTELPVSDAVVEVRKTVRATVKSVTNRNQPSPESYGSLSVGETVRSSTTPGGLYDNVREKVVSVTTGDVASECSRTVFDHVDRTTRNLENAPDQHVAGAGRGTWQERRASLTDIGTWDVQTTQHNELGVSNAVVELRKTLRGSVRSTTSRNQASSTVPANPSGMSVGETFRSSVTPGGLYDNVHETVVKTPVGTVSTGCSKTAFEHTDQKTTNQVNAPADHVGGAGGGTWTERQASLTDYGTWDVRDTTHNEIASSSAVVEVERTLRGVVRTVTHRNQSAVPSTGNLALGQSVRSARTNGGLYDNTMRTVDAVDVGVTSESCTRMSLVHSHGTTENVVKKPTTEQTASVNVEKAVSARLTDYGTWDVDRRITTRVPFGPQLVSSASYNTQSTQAHIFKNLPKCPTVTCGTNQGGQVNASVNDYGSYDGGYVTEQYLPWTGVVAKFTTSGQDVEIAAGRNQTSYLQQSANKGVDISAQSSLNSHGSFDWSCQKTTFKKLTGTSNTKWKTETTSTKVVRHDDEVSKSVNGEFGTTSVTLDDVGNAVTTETIYSPIAVTSGWITWKSKEKQVNRTYDYEHGLFIFKNVKVGDIYNIVRGTHNYSVHASINQYGLYDGQATYSDLADWENNDTGGSSEGGIAQGVLTVVDGYGRETRYQTKSFHGSGNQGTLAYTRCNQMIVAGVSLDDSTYIVGYA